jgi:hypothetical protein
LRRSVKCLPVRVGDDALPPPDVVTVGEVSMPAELYAVIVDAGYLAALDANFRCCSSIHDSCHPRKWCERAIRCGIHRAGGFPLIALTAQALERCLLALPLPPPLPTDALPALADAVSGLREFLGASRSDVISTRPMSRLPQKFNRFSRLGVVAAGDADFG